MQSAEEIVIMRKIETAKKTAINCDFMALAYYVIAVEKLPVQMCMF